MNKIIYSANVMTKLVEKGFMPIATMQNPRFPQYNCWVFEVTPEFSAALDEVLSDG